MKKARIDSTLLPGSWREVLTPRRISFLLAAYALVAFVLCAVLLTARHILLWEVRTNSQRLAELLASHVYAGDLQRIRGPEDMTTYEFRKILHYFQDVKSIYDDVAYIYTLRRDPVTGRWYFIVDANPSDQDLNRDGIISPNEKGAPPGLEFEAAAQIEELTEALSHPTADDDFTVDSWGTFISGYAPVVDPYSGRPVAVLGVDVTRETLEAKYATVKIASLLSFIVLLILVTVAFVAFYGRTQALQVARALDREVQEKNRALEQTVRQLREREGVMSQELSFAREVQERFLPRQFPLPDDLRFAAEYRACAEIGGDLYDAFRIHERTAGFFIADVVGHGVSAALVTAALKASIERYRQTIFQSFHRTADLQAPIESAALERFMHELNAAMEEILPPSSFLTIQMGVLLPDRQDLVLANAGHPPPIIWEKEKGAPRIVPIEANLPIGVGDRTSFEVAAIDVRPGDKFILYTDGVTERMNPDEETYGVERLLKAVRSAGHLPPDRLVGSIFNDIEQFSRGREAHDDQAIMVVELIEPHRETQVAP